MATLTLDDAYAAAPAAQPKKLSLDDAYKPSADVPDIHAAEDRPPEESTLKSAAMSVPRAIGAAAKGGWEDLKRDWQARQPDVEKEFSAGFWDRQKMQFDRLLATGRLPYDAFKIIMAPISGAVQGGVITPLAKGMARVPGVRKPGETTEQTEEEAKGDLGEALLAASPARGGISRVAGASKDATVPGAATVKTLLDRATGKEAAKAVEGVRTEATQRASGTATAEEQAAQTAAQRAAQLKGQQEQLQTQQPAKAAERAAAQTKPPAMGQVPGLEKERVVQRTREQARALEGQQREAAGATEQAQTKATDAQTRVQDAEKAVDDLDKKLLAQPRTTPEKFGTELRRTTEELHDKYATARAKEAGFDKALSSAGDELRVDTTPAQEQINQYLKDIRNPSLKRVLEGMRNLLSSSTESAEGVVGESKLSVRAADSLRKYLDSVIQTKMFGDQAVDKETLHVIKQLKSALVKSATEAWEPYRDALAKWRTLSRPLDIVERNGALRKVLDADPLSTDRALTEAQVVGRVLSQAKAGRPTFTRLAAENPNLRDSARLYFTQDLFGKDVVPTEAMLRNWLDDNETPLRQLGLYDEFKSVRAAKETAQRAVDEAKGTAKETMASARAAEKEETYLRQQVAKAAKVREAAKGRLETAQKAKPTAEEIKAQSTARAQEGAKRLEQRKGEVEKKQEKHEKSADTYRKFETELNAAVDKAVPRVTRQLVQRLRTEQRIDDKTYGDLLKQIDDAEAKVKDAAHLRTRMKRIALVAASSVGGYYLYRDARNLLGM